jgi:hypothetical protein
MSDEAEKSNLLEAQWQPVAVVNLEKPKRPRSALTAFWDIGCTTAGTVFCIVIWCRIWASDGWHPGWFDYSLIALFVVFSILGIVEGVRRWLSRPRAR